MNDIRYTISSIIKNKQGEYLTDNGWDKESQYAVLFAPQQAEATVNALSQKPTPVNVRAVYVIQNEKFDFYDGKKPWVYRIADAMFYATLQEAETEVKALSR